MALPNAPALDKVVEAIAPPSSNSLRWVEHAIAVGVGLKVAQYVYKKGPAAVLKDGVGLLLKGARVVPGLADVVAAEEAKAMKDIEDELLGDGDENAHTSIPAGGVSASEVVGEARRLRADDLSKHTHKWGGIYHGDDGTLEQVQRDILSLYASTNALYPGTFPSVRKFEAEVLAMTLDLVGTGTETGLITSGGTESIGLGMYAYVKHARETRGITEPEIVCCTTRHPALDKACSYFGVKLVQVPCDPVSFTMDPVATKAAITSNTLCVYASAPQWPHGIIDDVPTLAGIAKAAGVGCHVDNCLGGYLLSFLQKEGLLAKPFDFSVPGVTSMSVDIHKYGMASKGVSSILFKDNNLRRATYTPVVDWPGGYYVTSTMQGSRGGAVLAAAWGTLLHMGEDGYRRAARTIHEVTLRIVEGVKGIEGLRLIGNPDACCIAFESSDGEVPIYAVGAMMKTDHGFALAALQTPAAIQVCVGEQTAEYVEEWIAALRACVEKCRATPNSELTGSAGVYGSTAMLPPSEIVKALKGYNDVRLSVKPKHK